MGLFLAVIYNLKINNNTIKLLKKFYCYNFQSFGFIKAACRFKVHQSYFNCPTKNSSKHLMGGINSIYVGAGGSILTSGGLIIINLKGKNVRVAHYCRVCFYIDFFI